MTLRRPLQAMPGGGSSSTGLLMPLVGSGGLDARQFISMGAMCRESQSLDDFDACWDPSGVDPGRLDPVFLQFANGREAQKAAFKGEFFPSSMMSVDVGQVFVDFFQQDRFTGKPKGIISIPLSANLLLSRKVQP